MEFGDEDDFDDKDDILVSVRYMENVSSRGLAYTPRTKSRAGLVTAP